ncbi:NAD(FAD)-dependent dehydrogenase [Fervidicella metallireducens AeB]|uniref:NAD(FAD)-dependent dehydrogenase n=1 Tax=Fervidicella metallireducens AeB TaxID=1403537 RepID=A0A017RWG9_9CLOT|nr:DUF1667 domain-containing protein [Fervidicella metallireducens]EYE88749.1 NAD(FAD)-dependent dehydrogenase [Fervidicella metallireducens AeB]
MDKRELICIGCPLGCSLEVDIEHNNVVKVSGNQCKRGIDYAMKECTNPTRIITTTLEVIGGKDEMVAVKTDKDIPKDKIFDCIRVLKNIKVKAPIKIGEIIYKNILNTGANIVATSNVYVYGDS